MPGRCIFCSIVNGEAPAARVFEDEAVVAIMDLHPATHGHVLVIPKTHSSDLWEIDIEDAQRAMAASVHVASMIRRALAPEGINLLHASGSAAWQTVFHFHLHLIPRYRDDALVQSWRFDKREADRSVLDALAVRIRSAG